MKASRLRLFIAAVLMVGIVGTGSAWAGERSNRSHGWSGHGWSSSSGPHHNGHRPDHGGRPDWRPHHHPDHHHGHHYGWVHRPYHPHHRPPQIPHHYYQPGRPGSGGAPHHSGYSGVYFGMVQRW